MPTMFHRAQHTNGFRQNFRIRAIAAAFMPAALLVTAHPAHAQSAKAIVQKMIATYQGMNSYVGRSNTDQRLADPNGKVYPTPRYLDLAETDSGSVVRALPAGERVKRLGRGYPEWA